MKAPRVQKTILVVEPPGETVASKYLLAVTRPGNVTAGPSLIFLGVDRLDRCSTDNHALEAWRGTEMVAKFPDSLGYILVERGITRFVSMVQIARYEKAVNEQIRKVVGKDALVVDMGEVAALLEAHKGHRGDSKPPEDTRPSPGQYV